MSEEPTDLPDDQVFMARTKSFTRRARHLDDAAQRVWDTHAADYVVDIVRGEGETTVAEDSKRLGMRKLFDRDSLVRCEIGTGNGDQIVQAALDHPDRDFLGFEVYRPGLVKTINKAVKAGVTNIRLIEADAQQAFPILLPDACLDEVWLFFPDPWRKTRHHKRRLVQEDFALEVARVLRPGGLWRMATDWDDYAFWMRDVIEECPRFTNPYAGMNPDPADPMGDHGGFAPRWSGRVMTSFEKRGIEAGRTVRDVCAQLLP